MKKEDMATSLESGSSSPNSKERDDLKKILAAISRGVRPNLTDLNFYIQDEMEPMSTEGWTELRDMLCTAYGLSNEQLAERFKRPALLDREGTEDDFLTLLDDLAIGGFLLRLVEHTSGMEAPAAFSFFSGLAVLGASLHRRVWVDQYYYRIYPAMQVVLMGPSQKVKKSTASGYVVNLAVIAQCFPLLAQEGSSEGIKAELAIQVNERNQATGLIYVNELSNLLGEKEYNRDMVQVLTDLFDNRIIPLLRRTKKDGPIELKNMAISCVFNTNEKWAKTAIPPSAFEGGFMARVLIIHQLFSTKVIPTCKPRPPEEKDWLIDWLKRTKFINGEATMREKARLFYEDRYRWTKKNWPDDERLHPFWERLPDHMLKLGMLLSINADNTQRNGVDVELRHMEQAWGLLQWIAGKLPRLYAELGLTRFGDEGWEIVSYLYNNGGRLTEGKLFRRMMRKMGKTQLLEHLRTLQAARTIRRRPSKEFDGQWEYILLRGPEDL